MAFLRVGEVELDQKMPRKTHAMHPQPHALAQLQPQHGQADGNAQALGQDHVDEAVVRVVVMVHVAGEAQFFIEKMVQFAQLVQRLGVGHQAAFELGAHHVHFVQHLLDVQTREFILRQADGGFQQGKIVVALHQGGEIVQRRGL